MTFLNETFQKIRLSRAGTFPINTKTFFFSKQSVIFLSKLYVFEGVLNNYANLASNALDTIRFQLPITKKTATTLTQTLKIQTMFLTYKYTNDAAVIGYFETIIFCVIWMEVVFSIVTCLITLFVIVLCVIPHLSGNIVRRSRSIGISDRDILELRSPTLMLISCLTQMQK